MAFKRLVELSVGANGQGLLISDLDLNFKVTRSLTFSENTAEFKIYNAKQETRNKVLTEGNNLIFKAGYADEAVKTLFIGNITRANSEKIAGGYLTTVSASAMRSNTEALTYLTLALSYSANTQMSTILKDVASIGGLTITGANNANFTLINGWVYAGAYRGALSYLKDVLAAQNIGLYIDNAEIVVYRLNGQDSKFGSTFLTFNNGLLSVDSVTDSEDDRKRAKFKSILIPELQPNGLTTFDTNKIKGTFVIQKVIHSGNNYGGDFTSEGEVAA